MAGLTLGIDFGTSNSAAGISVNGAPYLVPLEPGETTLPTAVFFDSTTKSMRIGRSATRALIDGEDGRFMRALKSLLGTPLLYEKRRLGGELVDFSEVISRFLAEIKRRAEDHTRLTFTKALSGRPVKFHSNDPEKNARAEDDLRKCYLAAGFEDVQFLFEPEAALRASSVGQGYGLIVDIGGGTSDFTCFGRTADGDTTILASHGLRLGGTDFDRQISIDYAMPLLGRGTQIRNSFGGGSLPAPNRIFNDLATWQMIPFLYGPDSRRIAKDLARNAMEPEKLSRLVAVLDDELGHELAFAVEAGKIRANTSGGNLSIDLSVIEKTLVAQMSSDDMNRCLQSLVAQIQKEAAETLALAGIQPQQIETCVMVGGSALLAPVRMAIAGLCPKAELSDRRAMTAVADGLACAAEQGI